jgi:hypothetical protein
MTSVIGRHARGFLVAAAVVAIASMAYGDSPIELTDGVPVSGLSGDDGSEVDYKIVVPAGQGELEISISGGTGDCDLYVRYDLPPTYGGYDYRPFLWGNNETVTITNPAAGSWYIMLRGRDAYSGVTLVASYEPAVPTELENGVPETGISGGRRSDRLYCIDVPAGQGSLEVNTWDGTGVVDVYVKFGSAPSEFDYDADAYGSGTERAASISDPAAGRWYIVLHTSYHYDDVTLRAVYGTSGPAESVMDDVVIPNLSGALGSEAVYVIDAPYTQGGFDFRISGGTGNCDMYIKRGMRPTTSDYDDRQAGPGNTESVFISSGDLGGAWYILLVGTEAYSGVTLHVRFIPSSQPEPEPGPKPDGKATPLIPGVPVLNLAGKAGSEQFFSIEVPSNVKTLTIKMSGGTGDADLYVRKGALPTTSEYDYRPYLKGSNEEVVITKFTAGTWYIMVRGYQAFSGITLVATFDSLSPGGVVALQNGVPVTGLAGLASSEVFFKIEVPADQTQLEIAMSGGTGDADLYVRLGVLPTTKEWDYRPYRLGNKETVTIDDPKPGTYYIMIRGYIPYAGVTLQATYGPQGEQIKVLESCIPVKDLSGATDSEMFFKINVPHGQALLRVEISGGTGDADLYVKKGEKPTAKSWDYAPYLHGNSEVVEVQYPAAAAWYIMIRGYQAYAGLTLKACFHDTEEECDDCVIIIW